MIEVNVKKVSILSTSIFLFIIILLGKVLSFGKDVVISHYFGLSSEADSYFVALNITGVIFFAFYATISLVFLPLYNDIKEKRGKACANRFTSNALNVYLFVALLLTISCWLLAPFVLQLLDFETEESLNLTTFLLRIMSLSFVFTTVIAFMLAIQQSNQKYIFVHFPPVLNNLVVVLALFFLAEEYGIIIPAIAGVLAWAFQAPVYMFLTRPHFDYHPIISVKNTDMKRFGVLFIPAFIGVFADQANMLVDTVLALGEGAGGVSSINYAARLMSFSGGMVVMALMTIMYPIFAKHAALDAVEDLAKVIRKSLRIVVIIMMLVTSMVAVNVYEIVSIVFLRGSFTEENVRVTAAVFLIYSFGLTFLGIREVLNKVFYAKKKAMVALIASVAMVVVNIFLSINLVKIYGVEGLALATSISLIVGVVFQLYLLRKYVGLVVNFNFIPLLFQVLASSFFAGASMYMLKTVLSINLIMQTLLVCILGSIVFLVMMWVLKNEETVSLLRRLSVKWGR